MMRRSTPIVKLDDDSIYNICEYALEFCQREFGINGRVKKELYVSLCYYDNGGEYSGGYCIKNNSIILMMKCNRKLIEFIGTIIHEYIHYKQPVRTKYKKLLKEYGYWDHPFEVEAREVSLKYRDKLYMEFRKNNK
jgi:hypothetical protein